MKFTEMSPEELEKALDGQVNILHKLIEADEEIYANTSCPWCGSPGTIKAFDIKLYLKGDRPIPRYNMRCTDCNCLFSPFSGMILETGNIAKKGPIPTD